jgi:methionyl-tRNA synthetase
MDATQLIDPHSRNNPDDKLVRRESEHYFLDLAKFTDQILEYLAEHEHHWRPNVSRFSRNFVKEGLRGRPITRDIDWGIRVPLDGWEDKRLYVWFDAVMGYFTASIEWAKNIGQPDAWKQWWYNPDAKIYNFIGKDNVPFHTIIWPAILMGAGGYNLPYDVPANQYITMSGSKASTSQRWAVWVNDYLTRYDPDPLRYALAAQMPETADSDFSWGEFLRRNNDELVATWGNLVNRVLSLINRHFDGCVPEPGPLDRDATRMLDRAQSGLEQVGQSIEGVHLRQGIQQAFALAQETNRYLDQTEPWRAVRQDRQAAARSLYTSLSVIAALRTALAPYLPFSCQRLHEMLNGKGTIADLGWQMHALRPGDPLQKPTPLFRKLDPSIVEEEEARLGT